MARDWKIDLDNWQQIGKDAADLMLSLAEKKLAASIVAIDEQNKRTETLRNITIALLTLAIGYLIKDEASASNREYLVLIAQVTLGPLLFSSLFIILNFFSAEVTATPGATPETTLTQERFDGRFIGSEQFLDIVFDQLESYEQRIYHNELILKRIKNYNQLAGTAIFIGIPALLLIVFLASL
jgi:hypothetical protein